MDDLTIITATPGVVTLSSIGGNCPVQGYGTVQVFGVMSPPRFWYFRARGCGWSLTVGDDAGDGYVDDAADPDLDVCGDWGEGPYAAGWMPLDVAVRLIGLALSLWLEGARGEQEVSDG